jgi:hypothetical protein
LCLSFCDDWQKVLEFPRIHEHRSHQLSLGVKIHFWDGGKVA